MSVIPSPSKDKLDAPALVLTETERAAAVDVARRLRTEFRGLVNLLSAADRSASAMARALTLDRNICQRIVSGIGGDDAGEATLVRFPGVQGLRLYIERFGATNSSPAAREQLAAASAAVDAFDRLTDRIAGSQRRLRQRLEADLASDGGLLRGPADDHVARRGLFRAAAEVTGRWSEAVVSTVMIRPVPGKPYLTEGARIKGLIGHMWRPSALPLEIGESAADALATDGASAAANGAHQTLSARAARGDTPDSLIAEFCSSPLPRVTSRSLGNRTVQVIDAAEPVGTEGCDIVIGHRRAAPDKHPATLNPPVGEVSHLVSFPARRLVMDVYLHREIASACTASLELHLWNPSGGGPGMARWSTRFPGGPVLEHLGAGLSHAGSDAYARHSELTRHCFERLGWPAGEFIGFRCDVAYPVWRAGYFMLFDFDPSARRSGRADHGQGTDQDDSLPTRPR